MAMQNTTRSGDQPRITTKTLDKPTTPTLTYRTQTNRMGNAGNSSRMTRDYTRK